MIAKVFSGTIIGVDGTIVQVETDIARGLPAFSLVGLADGAVRESRDRVKAAIKNSTYEFPVRRITVNLAPADVKKEGSGFDLPIALGVLAASGVFAGDCLRRFCIVGELSLDGTVRPAKGVLPIAMAAREAGFQGMIVPEENGPEAAVIGTLDVIAVTTLSQAVEFLSGMRDGSPVPVHDRMDAVLPVYDIDFADVRGQSHAKRALEIAAAGNHNVLLQGPPGTGKTMLARRIPTIMPVMTFAEALETTRIYSVSGLLEHKQPLLFTRPFRAPHHTISDAALVGGGQSPRPGEISLAHNGVLFLDELAEFRKNVLEMLRQPLEHGTMAVSRAAGTCLFPAYFLMVASMNPCPCGFLYHPTRECVCMPHQVARYRSRISGPLLDRIDIHLEVPPVPVQELSSRTQGEGSAAIRARVEAARNRQLARAGPGEKPRLNSALGAAEIKKYCVPGKAAMDLLHGALARLSLSARAYTRILKVARTIADLEGLEDISENHIAEAIQLRRFDRT